MGKMAETIVKFLNKTEGRDKIYKIFASLAKASAPYLEESGHVELAGRVNKAGGFLGDTRKIMRLFKSFIMVQKIISTADLDPVVAIFNVLSNFGFALYLYFDNRGMLHKMTILPIANKADLELNNWRAALFWIFAMIFSCGVDLRKLMEMYKLERASKRAELASKGGKNEESRAESHRQLVHNQRSKKMEQLLNFIKNFCDLMNAINMLKNGSLWHSKYDGMIGLVSGILAARNQWQTC